MSGSLFCCPVCKERLSFSTSGYVCRPCGRSFGIVNGVPDLFVSESESDAIDEPNKTWTLPEMVQARDTYYRLCTRELRGMAFCMREIGKRTFSGCRVLEVGMGTGHFTRWLAEAVEPGTEIYAFDFSWPIIEKAVKNAFRLAGVTLFRANARGRLPFQDGTFDIVYVRLAPLGAHGVPNVQAAFELLKPGGWHFEAAWVKEQFDVPPTEWAIQHGFDSAEHHSWQCQRVVTEEEVAAKRIEQDHLLRQFEKAGKMKRGPAIPENLDGGIVMTYENLIIARKPLAVSHDTSR